MHTGLDFLIVAFVATLSFVPAFVFAMLTWAIFLGESRIGASPRVPVGSRSARPWPRLQGANCS